MAEITIERKPKRKWLPLLLLFIVLALAAAGVWWWYYGGGSARMAGERTDTPAAAEPGLQEGEEIPVRPAPTEPLGEPDPPRP